MKKITNKVLWIFAVGQFGWSLLSGIISSWMVYYYTGENAAFSSNISTQPLFLGLTLFGIITAGQNFRRGYRSADRGLVGQKQL